MTRAFPSRVKDGIDPSSIEGAYNIPYSIPNIFVDYVMKESGVPVGFWRSVGSSQNAFITECFLDEIAAASGKDPYNCGARSSTGRRDTRRCSSWPRPAPGTDWGAGRTLPSPGRGGQGL